MENPTLKEWGDGTLRSRPQGCPGRRGGAGARRRGGGRRRRRGPEVRRRPGERAPRYAATGWRASGASGGRGRRRKLRAAHARRPLLRAGPPRRPSARAGRFPTPCGAAGASAGAGGGAGPGQPRRRPCLAPGPRRRCSRRASRGGGGLPRGPRRSPPPRVSLRPTWPRRTGPAAGPRRESWRRVRPQHAPLPLGEPFCRPESAKGGACAGGRWSGGTAAGGSPPRPPRAVLPRGGSVLVRGRKSSNCDWRDGRPGSAFSRTTNAGGVALGSFVGAGGRETLTLLLTSLTALQKPGGR